MKVVIDTNVLIDADADDFSYANKIIDEVIGGRIQAFANRGTVGENRLISSQILGQREYIQKIESFLEALVPVGNAAVDVSIDDEEDRKILASAVSAGAEYLITSDKHLLKLEEYQGVKIVEPAVFWNRYRQEVLGENDWSSFINDWLRPKAD